MSQTIHHIEFSKELVIAGQALTSSYAADGVEIHCQGHTTLFLHIAWTQGDETSLEFKVVFFNESAATTEYQETSGSTTTGVTTISDRSYTMSSATNPKSIPIRIEGKFAKIYVKASGGTPTGSYGINYLLKRE